MGAMVAAMLLAVMIVQSRLSNGTPGEVEEPVDDKIYVELGFEPEEESETVSPEPVNDSVEFNLDSIEPAHEPVEEQTSLEHEEVFYDSSFEASEPVIIETPNIIIEEPEQVQVEEPIKPMFEASYEPSEPVVIEAPEMVVIEEPETVEVSAEEGPMFEISYEESMPVVIETESMILEPEETPESTPEEVVDHELVEELEPETSDEPPELEEEQVVEEAPLPEEEPSEPEQLIEETPEVVEAIEAPKPKKRRKMRKPIIDESDPDINLDMGVKSCPHCGSEVPDTIYCINCGKSLDP